MKPELSEKNPYYIPKHRYYELYHFCLQYPTWIKAFESLDGLAKRSNSPDRIITGAIIDPTAKAAESAIWFLKRINMVDYSIEKVDPDGKLYEFMLLNVTKQYSYDAMCAKWTMPCSKDEFYKKRREFFWHLSQARE